MWKALTRQDFIDQLTEDEATAVEAIQGSDDKIAAILVKVIAQVREDILAGGFELHATTTFIPEGLHNDAISVLRWKVLTSLPEMADLQTDARKEENTQALRKLRDIALGDRKVEPPTGSTGFQSAPKWNSENKIVGRMHPTPRPGQQQGNADGAYANDDAPQDAT